MEENEMKKIIAIVLIAVMALAAFTACKKNDNKPAEDVKGEGVMTHEQYVAAEIGAEVVVETYVQAKQSWWDNKGTFYTQDTTALTSSMRWAAPRKSTTSSFPAPRSRSPVIRLSGPKAPASSR